MLLPRRCRFLLPLLFLLAALPGLAAPVRAQTPHRYIEFVRQKSPCRHGNCFDEYMMLDNGITVRKLLDTPDYKGLPRMEVRRIDPAPVFKAIADFARDIPSGPDVEYALWEVFFLTGKPGNPYVFSTKHHPPPALVDFGALVDRAFAAGDKTTPDFYVHEYYQPMTTDRLEDTHVFSDGTVVLSQFDKDSNALLHTSLSAAAPGEMRRIRRMAETVMLAPPRETPCPQASGLAYGHLEIRLNGGLKQFETCGRDDSDASALFRFIRDAYYPEDARTPR
ncbi:MAG: hypothetical protein GC185_12265 [Alphaproteobacteria bacterium]|nr:hypothetical protein [Alphaproteobacteria bacterium]